MMTNINRKKLEQKTYAVHRPHIGELESRFKSSPQIKLDDTGTEEIEEPWTNENEPVPAQNPYGHRTAERTPVCMSNDGQYCGVILILAPPSQLKCSGQVRQELWAGTILYSPNGQGEQDILPELTPPYPGGQRDKKTEKVPRWSPVLLLALVFSDNKLTSAS